jgi:preprotein translocase subunit SecA
MELLERAWEGTGTFFGGIMRGFERGVTALFGSSNARFVKRLQAKVDAINSLEPKYQAMSDDELKEQTFKFKQRLKAGETTDDILVEAFAVCREAGRRFLGMRHYDVQLIGGMVLHSGSIAEMVTGEGKTLVATLPAYLNALEGKGVHVVTVNDYLARRDMEWMGPLYIGLGLNVGNIQSDMEVEERQKAYDADITYGTNNEFGFDYLRDNMRPAARGDNRWPKRMQQSQQQLHFAIIDEVDNILIDEARTPLIISGPAFDNPKKYADADRIARTLMKDTHFEVNEKDHAVTLTDEGVRQAEKLAGVESFYTAGNMEWPHLIDNALKAHHLYKRDVNYVVKEGRVVIVDEFTGRLMEGRQWSDGLHQAVEAKEGVKIKEETQTLATITLQNFFKLYKKICGMTGTAMTEAGEFWKIYKLDVVAIPTNRQMQRIEHHDVIYRSEREKFIAVADEIERMQKWDTLFMRDGSEVWGTITDEDDQEVTLESTDKKQKERYPQDKIRRIERKGRPILVGTVSIEKSERLSSMLDKRGIKHEVLNAKHHKREAEIISQAGRMGHVTIATNMAGRGTDIVLGGNAETMAWAQLQDKYPTRLEVPPEEWDNLVRDIEIREDMKAEGKKMKELGGLHVMGTERHEARRIDLQLRGRCGRQGDPGSSRFFLSLEDDLMRIFAGPWVKTILERLGMEEGEKIESRMVSRRIEAAQRKVEERHFDARKNLLEYDELMDEQRKRVYSFRQRIIEGENCRQVILDMLRDQVDEWVGKFLDKNFGVDAFAAFASSRLNHEFKGRDFRGMEFERAEQAAKDEASRMAETFVQETIDENLPGDSEEDQVDWNWDALAKTAHARWGLQLRDRDLKKLGRDHVGEYLLEEARAAIDKVDLADGKEFLAEDFAIRTVAGWCHAKLGLEVAIEDIKPLDAAALKRWILERAIAAYDEKEAEYPVLVGMYRFTSGGGEKGQLDREGLISWARTRFDEPLAVEDFRNMQREEIRARLVQASKACNAKAEKMRGEASEQLKAVEADANSDREDALQPLANWLANKLDWEGNVADFVELDAPQLQRAVLNLVEDKYRPEMRRMERQVLLQLVDTGWKDHLLALDRIKSGVGLVGYAQLDAKVEYKREGMRTFEQMWDAIAERSTDLIFKMEQLDEEFVGSTFVETSARHDEAVGLTEEISQQQEQTNQASQPDVRPEPIRNKGTRVGRNDPCPCGSGKKYKNCHMRQSGAA